MPLRTTPQRSYAFQAVIFDFIGPISPPSSKNHAYILVLMCPYSRWMELRPMKTLKSTEIVDALLDIFMKLSVLPEFIQCDNQASNVSELLLLIYARLGLKLYTPPAYRPEQQGIVERSNAVVKRMLHHILAQAKNPRDWHTKLNHIAWAYRVPKSLMQRPLLVQSRWSMEGIPVVPWLSFRRLGLALSQISSP